jgi:predicted SAM-dependent methyltransferase
MSNTIPDSSNQATLAPALKLNLGCGPVQPEGWVNVDGSNRARLARYAPWLDALLVRLGVISPTEFNRTVKVLNLFHPLPWADRTVDAIYAGELWEHFEYPDSLKLTHECARVLKPGGVLRVCVPDGPTFWRKYLEALDQEMSKPPGERDAKPLRDRTLMFFRDICTRRKLLGSMGHTHKWQFDEVQLVDMFQQAGLRSVERARFHQSRIADVERVERSDFLIVEGVKP